jgi:hypothetical protein
VKKKFRIVLFLIFNILIITKSYAGEEVRSLRLGFSYTLGKQPFFPFSSPDYIYTVQGLTVLTNYPVAKRGRFSYELQIEPGIYSARHRLLNEFFVQPNRGPDYLEQRERFTKDKTIPEYALNLGFQVRYDLKAKISFFLLASLGPMYSGTETERLAKGFAFADVIALGLSYKTGKFMFEIRPGLRHVSNANLQYPNSGHNSSNLDFGISLFL